MTAKFYGELAGDFLFPMMGVALGISQPNKDHTMVGFHDYVQNRVIPAKSYGDAFMSEGLLGVYKYKQQEDRKMPPEPIEDRVPDQIINDYEEDVADRVPDQVIIDDYNSDEELLNDPELVVEARNEQPPQQPPNNPPNDNQQNPPLLNAENIGIGLNVIGGAIQYANGVQREEQKDNQAQAVIPDAEDQAQQKEAPTSSNIKLSQNRLEGTTLDRHDILRSTLAFK